MAQGGEAYGGLDPCCHRGDRLPEGQVAELERSEAELKARVEELTREVGEREEMLGDDNT